MVGESLSYNSNEAGPSQTRAVPFSFDVTSLPGLPRCAVGRVLTRCQCVEFFLEWQPAVFRGLRARPLCP
jgi:hypothetical protein